MLCGMAMFTGFMSVSTVFLNKVSEPLVYTFGYDLNPPRGNRIYVLGLCTIHDF